MRNAFILKSALVERGAVEMGGHLVLETPTHIEFYKCEGGEFYSFVARYNSHKSGQADTFSNEAGLASIMTQLPPRESPELKMIGRVMRGEKWTMEE
jgi:hypothetical protein